MRYKTVNNLIAAIFKNFLLWISSYTFLQGGLEFLVELRREMVEDNKNSWYNKNDDEDDIDRNESVTITVEWTDNREKASQVAEYVIGVTIRFYS